MDNKDRILGSIVGGAIGDALGAPIEFLSLDQISTAHGESGVQGYVEFQENRGMFTDDTQMTIFTAEGLIRLLVHGSLEGFSFEPYEVIYQSYLRWLQTQGRHPAVIPDGMKDFNLKDGWLLEQSGMYKLRSPGLTCLRSLESGRIGTIDQPLNDSKGCGGVMRVAPIGLIYVDDPDYAFGFAAEAAAITHSHPSGYLSAGCLASILAYLGRGDELMIAVMNTIDILISWDDHSECLQAVEDAVSLFHHSKPTPANIESLGGAWVGEEALSISIFCALHFQKDFRNGVLASIFHGGDSDSTGAITGNILGAISGYEAIPAEWKSGLMHLDIVEQVGLDLDAVMDGDKNISEPSLWSRYPL